MSEAWTGTVTDGVYGETSSPVTFEFTVSEVSLQSSSSSAPSAQSFKGRASWTNGDEGPSGEKGGDGGAEKEVHVFDLTGKVKGQMYILVGASVEPPSFHQMNAGLLAVLKVEKTSSGGQAKGCGLLFLEDVPSLEVLEGDGKIRTPEDLFNLADEYDGHDLACFNFALECDEIGPLMTCLQEEEEGGKETRRKRSANGEAGDEGDAEEGAEGRKGVSKVEIGKKTVMKKAKREDAPPDRGLTTDFLVEVLRPLVGRPYSKWTAAERENVVQRVLSFGYFSHIKVDRESSDVYMATRTGFGNVLAEVRKRKAKLEKEQGGGREEGKSKAKPSKL